MLFTLFTLFIPFALPSPLGSSLVRAQEADHTQPPPAVEVPKVKDRADLEREFAETLSGAVLRGTWQMTGNAAEGAVSVELSAPKPEQYEISKAGKINDDYWLISARITFAEKDVTIPVPVRVVWAEDTPVISLTNVTLPMLGTYSARVMIYGHFYAGTWFGAGHGGVMSGRIVKNAETSASDRAQHDPGPDAGQSK